MTRQIKQYMAIGLLLLFILAPRLAMLGNGLDSQRIWDTNTPAAFRWLSAFKEHRLSEFYGQGQKYPLLGPYTFLPVIALYYEANHLVGQYASAEDFINAYALGETNLFGWIRLEMLLMNLAALYLLYRLTKRFTENSLVAGPWAILFASINFYITLFAVTPRIHHFAFLGTTLTLYASLMLLEKKTTKNYLLAFGAAALTASVAQSGITTLVLPLLAHCYDSASQRWSLKINKKIILGIIEFICIVLIIGYPRTLFMLTDPSINFYQKVILGDNHEPPVFAFQNFIYFIFQKYFFSSELVTTWLLFCGAWFLWFGKKTARFRLAPPDLLVVAHCLAFFAIFGFNNYISGRFTLVILPSIFFLLARLINRLATKRSVLYPLVLLALIQGYGIIQLTRIALNNDTRADAANFLLQGTKPNDRILSTMDKVLLGITPSPESVKAGEAGVAGVTDAIIAEKNLVGKKSRGFVLWDPASSKITSDVLKSFRYVVVSSDAPGAVQAKDYLLGHNFRLAKTFFAKQNQDTDSREFIPWDIITPLPSLPLPIKLREFRALGPTINIYERS